MNGDANFDYAGRVLGDEQPALSLRDAGVGEYACATGDEVSAGNFREREQRGRRLSRFLRACFALPVLLRE